MSDLLAASDAHPGRVLDDLCQRPLLVGLGWGGVGGKEYTVTGGSACTDPPQLNNEEPLNAKRPPAKPAPPESDLSQRRRDRVHGGEPGQGRWLIGAAQHHGVPGVRGVQLQLSEGGDKKN